VAAAVEAASAEVVSNAAAVAPAAAAFGAIREALPHLHLPRR